MRARLYAIAAVCVAVVAVALGVSRAHGSAGPAATAAGGAAATIPNADTGKTAGAAAVDDSRRAADTQDDADSADTFHGYACTVDCSGHEAGYSWAEEQGITDPDDCPIDPHNSHSFTEGCWAFAGRDGPDD